MRGTEGTVFHLFKIFSLEAGWTQELLLVVLYLGTSSFNTLRVRRPERLRTLHEPPLQEHHIGLSSFQGLFNWCFSVSVLEVVAVLECWFFADLSGQTVTILKGHAVTFFWAAWLLKLGPVGCPETSINNYQNTLRNIPEERRPQLYCGRSLNPPILSLNAIFTTEHVETGRSLVFQGWIIT